MSVKHARLAPHAAHRWTVCPGSVRMEAEIPDVSSAYADEGTVAHQVAHWCVNESCDADRFLGAEIEVGGNTFVVDEEMVDGVNEYLEFVRSLIQSKTVEWQAEQFVDLTWIGVEGLDGGTADFSAYDTKNCVLDIVDLKYGRGVFVEPYKNMQLRCYAIGVVRRYSNRGLKKVRLTVVQPRCPAPNGQTTRTWDADVLSIFDFETDIRKLALATLEPDAPLVPGEHCRFCKAGPTCSARATYAMQLAQAEFDAFGDLELTPAPAMSSDRLAEVLRHATQIEAWTKSVKEYAHNEAIHGRMPTGFKLVAKRAMRKWKNESEARDVLWGFGFDDGDLYISKMKSPAQIEPLLLGKNKKERAAAIEALVVKESSGTVLAPNEDSRPAVQANASEFGEVTE